MESKATKYFNDVIKKLKIYFTEVNFCIDATNERVILKSTAKLGSYDVYVTELICKEYRKYSYYLLKDEYIVVGFDNAQDIRAIKMKFAKIPDNDIEKLVPHIHLENKTKLDLTKEIVIQDFISWITQNVK